MAMSDAVKNRPAAPPAVAPLDAAQVRALCASLLDREVAAILETGASLADLEAALAWAEGEDEVLGLARAPLDGAAAAVYDLLTTQYDLFEER
jgi:hypothetical protein